MIKDIPGTRQLFESLDDVFSEVIELISSLGDVEINTIPFKDSWTAGQLTSHITKSNKAIGQSLSMNGKPCERNPAQGVAEIKKTFLDFNVKFKSPEFIIPSNGSYKKEIIINEYKTSAGVITDKGLSVDLSEIIHLPAFGDITKFEILNFVVFHTQRHIHQLRGIMKSLQR